MVRSIDDVSISTDAVTDAVCGRSRSISWLTQRCTTASATVFCCCCEAAAFAYTMPREYA